MKLKNPLLILGGVVLLALIMAVFDDYLLAIQGDTFDGIVATFWGDVNITNTTYTEELCLDDNCRTTWPTSNTDDGNNYTSSISFNVTGTNYQLNLERAGMDNLTANFSVVASGTDTNCSSAYSCPLVVYTGNTTWAIMSVNNTALNASSFTNYPWASIEDIPAGFADGTDDTGNNYYTNAAEVTNDTIHNLTLNVQGFGTVWASFTDINTNCSSAYSCPLIVYNSNISWARDACNNTPMNASQYVNYSWTNLADIPAGFADNTDDTGGASSASYWVKEPYAIQSTNNTVQVGNYTNISTAAVTVQGDLFVAKNLITPYLMAGSYQNFLLQSEAFENTAWTKVNVSTPTANIIYTPYDTLAAENVAPLNRSSNSVYDAHIYQNVSHTWNGTYIFSVWARANTSNATAIIGLDLTDNITFNATYPNGAKFFRLNNDSWTRVYIVENITTNHNRVAAKIMLGNNSLHLWGAQLEAFNYSMATQNNPEITPTIYYPTTTGAVNARTTRIIAEVGITSLGSYIGTSAALSSTLGATAITGTGALTTNIASTGVTVSTDGLVTAASTAATAILQQNSPRLRLSSLQWNGTASLTYSYSRFIQNNYNSSTNNSFSVIEYATFPAGHNARSNITNITIINITISPTNNTFRLNATLFLPQIANGTGGYLCVKPGLSGEIYRNASCPIT